MLMPTAGGAPRLLIRLDNPAQRMHRVWFRVRGSRFYFKFDDQRSDIWTTEVLGSR
jgi:hypothetical protein